MFEFISTFKLYNLKRYFSSLVMLICILVLDIQIDFPPSYFTSECSVACCIQSSWFFSHLQFPKAGNLISFYCSFNYQSRKGKGVALHWRYSAL